LSKKVWHTYKNGYIGFFNGKLRDGLLNREVFDTPPEAQIIIEGWRKEYNTQRTHSSLGYRPPAPEAIHPAQASQLDLSRGNYQIQVGTS
jgi:putative transposase